MLGFRDAQHCARRLGARLGMRKSDINALSYTQVVAGVAACLVQRAPISGLIAMAGAALRRAIGATAVLVVAIVGSLDTDDDLWRRPDADNELVRRIKASDDDRPHPVLERLAS